MARKTKQPSPPAQGHPSVPPAQAIELLSKQVEKAKSLLQSRPLTDDDHSAWELLTSNLLEKAFGANSPNVSSVTDVGKFGSFPMNAGEEWWENQRRSSLQTQISRLGGLIELLTTEVQLGSVAVPTVQSTVPHGRKVFLVHGHDERYLAEVARYLEKLKQEVIVLREQPSSGRTIIEKFEDYSDVGFAVVLLTPDDRGGTAATGYDAQKSRARQNVIFELGYFIGRLSRQRVCALHAQGVEIPSDYAGVAYVLLDQQGAWRFELAKELKAAGLDVDMNLAL